MLRRIERDAIVACAAMAIVAWAIARGDVAAPLGVLTGGLLAAISYRGIKGGIDAVVAGGLGGDGAARARTASGLVKFFTRYGILAVAAYVIMVRLRVLPVAVFAGASSLVVAAMFEALRGVVTRQR
jgi:hypothetical protein